MANMIKMTYKVRKRKNSLSGGKILEKDVPEFNWDEFKKLPNAETFAKKQYYASVRKIMREIEEKKSKTDERDLSSMEYVIARSITYTKEELEKWFGDIDWQKSSIKNIGRNVEIIKEILFKILQDRDYIEI
ncbi:MAG: hypothetical protein HQL33_00045 [Alphaproteobacteria bacterium]|nr:hypothetical protein [Alphaproteobacteria bacterium]